MYMSSDNNHIALPYNEALSNLIPHAKEFTWQGNRMMLIPNRHDEAKIARNLGIPVPAPILTRYDWRGMKPWDVQKTTAAMLTESTRAYVLSSFGCGKTRAAIWAADYLLQQRDAKRVLIVAPLSTLNPVWEAELFRVLPTARVKVLHGPRAKRLELLSQDAEWYVINHHGLPLLHAELAAKQFDIVIIDELATFRNRSTQLWKAAAAVVSPFGVKGGIKYAWGMTGSPTPQAPTDAWAQVRLLTPDRTVRTLTRFKDDTMMQVSTFRWVPRADATSIVHQAMSPSVRFTLEDVQELPPTSYIDRKIILDPPVAKAYKHMFDKMVLMTNKGESITASNEGVLQNKLMQIACGYVYTDDKTVFAMPNKSRLDALLELVSETDRKVIVFVPYIHALQGIADALKKSGESVEIVYGATAKGARDRIFRAFQESVEPRIIVAHPQCMSHGLSLVAANTIIWYAPVQSLETYEQANARIARPGQKHKTMIAHLVGTSVERAVYARLKERSRLQGLLLELFHAQHLEY
jgi:SNF2 family DNA or RNA helicase